MEDIDIKNFTRVSSVTDEDSVLLSRGVSSATHGQIAFGLFRSSVSKDISPSIVNGIWHIGSTNTGIEAKGADGKTPVFSTGTVATGLPDTNVIVQVRYDGINENGNPSYVIDFTIPAGKPGQDGDGAGNVYVTTDGLESGKTYLFQPGADGSANGTMVEFTGKEIEGGVGKEYPGYTGAEIFNDYENNIAAGKNAHAEGQETNATGPRSHAEGYKTTVYAADSHAEGRSTWALGAQSHVEGLYGIGWGAASHTEGCVVTDFGAGEESYSLLNEEELIRDFLHTCATLIYPDGTDGAYYYQITSDALSAYRLHGALGVASHAEGVNNIVCDQAGHVEGYGNVCGDMIPGMEQDSAMYAPHAEGFCNRIASRVLAPHIGGAYCMVNSGNYSFAHGYNLSVSNDYEVAFGRYNLSEYNGKKVLFSYGIGVAGDRRENAFSVLEDGSVVIPKMEGGNAEELIANSLKSVWDTINKTTNKITNNYNELTAIINKQQEQIDSLISMIYKLHPQLKVFVVGERLVMTSMMDAEVSGEKLNILDDETKVEGKILIFGEYTPPEQDSKAYVWLKTLYFTELSGASVQYGLLTLTDNDITAVNGVLTIK